MRPSSVVKAGRRKHKSTASSFADVLRPGPLVRDCSTRHVMRASHSATSARGSCRRQEY
ncbi:hypothetical protein WJR50_06865 [Catalinimonas sp. 4WD22]|uniref:hypothetical protein n=1 Tax=Catalinimonas locisalis TaxID=3133978 RepID=UPI003100BBC9